MTCVTSAQSRASFTRLRPLSLPKLEFPNLDPLEEGGRSPGSARERGCETEEGAACWMELVLAASSSLFLRKEALRPQQPLVPFYILPDLG